MVLVSSKFPRCGSLTRINGNSVLMVTVCLINRTCYFCAFSFFFSVCDGKRWRNFTNAEKIILASKRCSKHLFAGRNTQHTALLRLDRYWKELLQVSTNKERYTGSVFLFDIYIFELNWTERNTNFLYHRSWNLLQNFF